MSTRKSSRSYFPQFSSPLIIDQVVTLLKRSCVPQRRWKELGLTLGLLKDSLDAIAENYSEVEDRFIECIARWLRRADNVDSKGGTTFDSLSDSLKSMNENAAADKLDLWLDQENINKEHLTVQFNCPISQTEPRVSVVGQKFFIIQGDRSHSLQWDRYGFRLYCPEGAVSKDTKVEVIALAGGNFKLPIGTTLVSAVYAISVSQRLLKPLTIKLQHFFDLRYEGQTRHLKFVTGPLKFPYQLSHIRGGSFSVRNRFGSIKRDKFCFNAIVAEMSDGDTYSDSDETPSEGSSDSEVTDSDGDSSKAMETDESPIVDDRGATKSENKGTCQNSRKRKEIKSIAANLPLKKAKSDPNCGYNDKDVSLLLEQNLDKSKLSDDLDGPLSQSEGQIQQQGQESEGKEKIQYINKDEISKLSVILEPVEDDWYHIGQCLEVKESVLTEIKEMKTADSRLTCVLESWCHEEKKTIKELVEPLKRLSRDDILKALYEFTTAKFTVNDDDDNIKMKDLNEVDAPIKTETRKINFLVSSQDLEGPTESQIAGRKLFLVQREKSQLIDWDEYGLKISVLEGSLETGKVSVTALVGGNFKFPDNTRLVSAVYAISTSPLLKSLRIEMQHCIDLSDPSLSKYLKFAVAPVHTASLPYQFSVIEGGEFPAYQRYGYIEQSKFCLLAIVGEEEETGGKGNGQPTERESGEVGRQEGEPVGIGSSAGREEEGNGLRESVDYTEDPELSTSQSNTIVPSHSTGIPEATVYAGQVFYQRADKMRLAAARNLKALRQYINKTYSIYEMDEDFTFKLNSSLKYIQLIFDGPQSKPTTGWTVSPHKNPCLIRERDLLGFGTPSCLVSIYAESNPDTVPKLIYSVPLRGIQEPMTIIINRSLKDLSAVDHSVGDVPNPGSQNDLKKHLNDLKRFLSTSEAMFRDIANGCKEVQIINSSQYNELFDGMNRQSLLERVDLFIGNITLFIEICPEQISTFLSILRERDHFLLFTLAEKIAASFR